MIDVHGGLSAECDIWDIVTEGGYETTDFPSLALDKCGFFQNGRYLSQVIPNFPNLSQIYPKLVLGKTRENDCCLWKLS